MNDTSKQLPEGQVFTDGARPIAASMAVRFQARDAITNARRAISPSQGLRAHLRRIRDTRPMP
jgi:hypothetical protein